MSGIGKVARAGAEGPLRGGSPGGRRALPKVHLMTRQDLLSACGPKWCPYPAYPNLALLQRKEEFFFNNMKMCLRLWPQTKAERVQLQAVRLLVLSFAEVGEVQR